MQVKRLAGLAGRGTFAGNSAMLSPIPRIPVPPAGQTAEGWCLYEDDRWDGPAPQEWDDDGWIVYPDPSAATWLAPKATITTHSIKNTSLDTV
ncbi:MAG: hypothetical protein MUF31_07480 [Akkermansiaceae bacterium]|nr:hypothetical protein [Akkermansiaceae bacterium]